MQTYDTLRAGAIHDVRVGRSVLTDAPLSRPAKISDDDWAKRQKDAEAQRVGDSEATAARDKKLAEISADASKSAEQKRAAADEVNKSYNDRLQSADATQDIIHVTLAGGEKRSILRDAITFHDAVMTRGQLENYPGYAQRGPAVSRGQYAPSGQYLPPGQVMSEQVPRDGAAVAMRGQVPRNVDNKGNVDLNNPAPVGPVNSDGVYPVIGDYLVEYFDPVNDVFVQKIYDAATFARYFKASLN
jgi:hypothetical protein